MGVTALAPWYGSNRMLAEHVGRALAGCEWVGVAFAGGMCELRGIKARTIVVSDLHRHVINLARVVADGDLCERLVQRLNAATFHPDELADAQRHCIQRENFVGNGGSPPIDAADAADYFVCCWMTRSGSAGTPAEFTAGLSVRWEAGGGDSVVRFRSAVEALKEWQAVLSRCTFVCLDVLRFLEKCKDEVGHGLYLDPPFPGPGDRYTHRFTEAQHRQLAERLGEFDRCRVVCRFYDHPLIRELYPEPAWEWTYLAGRTQANKAAPEVLLVRNGDRRAERPVAVPA